MTLSRKTAKNEVLPKGWRRMKLGELCSDISYGYTATASSKPIGPKFLRITDIVSDRINWESVPYCEIEDSKKDKYTLGIGDIVIARTGATTGYNQIIRSDVHSVFASYLIRCKLKQSIAYPFFISCVLQSAYWRNFIEGIKARSAQPGANAKDFSSFRIPLPTLPEQKAIASLLETWDTAIEKTEALIAAKEKQFKWLLKTLISDQQDNPAWRKVKLGDFTQIKTGKKDNQDKVEDGKYPFFVRSEKVERINTYSFNGEAILIPGEGEIEKVIHYVNGKFDYHQRVYKISHFSDYTYGKFIFYFLKINFPHQARKYSVKATADSLRMEAFAKMIIHLPDKRTQKQISTLLDTSQQEIYLLKQLIEQYRTQKRGLMQELLTGKWRIHDLTSSTAARNR